MVTVCDEANKYQKNLKNAINTRTFECYVPNTADVNEIFPALKGHFWKQNTQYLVSPIHEEHTTNIQHTKNWLAAQWLILLWLMAAMARIAIWFMWNEAAVECVHYSWYDCIVWLVTWRKLRMVSVLRLGESNLPQKATIAANTLSTCKCCWSRSVSLVPIRFQVSGWNNLSNAYLTNGVDSNCG